MGKQRIARALGSAKALEPCCDHLRGHPPRCQAIVKSTGKQCKKAAVRGLRVCPNHGAGYPKRVKEGKRKDPMTASVKHRLYSGLVYDDFSTLLDRILATIDEHHATNRELAVVKSALETAINRYASRPNLLEEIDHAYKALERKLSHFAQVGKPIKATAIRKEIQELNDLLYFSEQSSNQIERLASKIIMLEKTRATIRFKLAKMLELQQLILYISAARDTFATIASQKQLDLLEESLRREILNPLRLELLPLGATTTRAGVH